MAAEYGHLGSEQKGVKEAEESGFQVAQKPNRPEKLKAVVARRLEAPSADS